MTFMWCSELLEMSQIVSIFSPLTCFPPSGRVQSWKAVVPLPSSEQSAQEHPSLEILCSVCTAVTAQRHTGGGQQIGDLICS